jgi:hypothetical protein
MTRYIRNQKEFDALLSNIRKRKDEINPTVIHFPDEIFNLTEINWEIHSFKIVTKDNEEFVEFVAQTGQ